MAKRYLYDGKTGGTVNKEYELYTGTINRTHEKDGLYVISINCKTWIGKKVEGNQCAIVVIQSDIELPIGAPARIVCQYGDAKSRYLEHKCKKCNTVIKFTDETLYNCPACYEPLGQPVETMEHITK